VAARRIAVEVGRKTVIFKTKMGALLLPAIAGFSAQDRADGPIINLSYYVFPAFPRLKIVAPEYDWSGLVQSGLDILKASNAGGAKLPADWLSVRETDVKPAEGFPPHFAYNAIRIPLYLAWAGIGEREHYREFQNWAKRRSSVLPVIDVKTGRDADTFREPGYAAVAHLLDCIVAGGTSSGDLAIMRDGQNYYPATLHLMSIIAVQMRYASCLRI
jgi:endoglucanase